MKNCTASSAICGSPRTITRARSASTARWSPCIRSTKPPRNSTWPRPISRRARRTRPRNIVLASLEAAPDYRPAQKLLLQIEGFRRKGNEPMATIAEARISDSAELKKRIERFQCRARQHSRPGPPGDRRAGGSARPDPHRAVRRRPLPDHRPARHGEDADGAHHRADAGPRVQAHPVHAGPDALRHHRHGHHRGRPHHRAIAAGPSCQGPIFGNIVLADEINRTPPKTQSALLEAMQELSCTVRGNQYKLPAPFFVLATQNPIELEGTYPLPEAQLDRFLFNTVLDYLSAADEVKVVDLTTTTRVAQVRGRDQRRGDSRLPAAGAHGADRASRWRKYVVEPGPRHALQERRARRTSSRSTSTTAASVRAAQFIVLAAKARALAQRRYHVTYEDITALATPVLRHRILLNFHAESDRIDSDEILRQLARAYAAAQGRPRCAALPRSRGARRHLRPRPGGEDRRGRLRRRPAPLARLRLQPGVRRIPRLLAGRRPAPRRLERLRAHRARLSQALSRRDQQPAHRAARRQQFDEVHLPLRSTKWTTRATWRPRCFISRSRSARRRGPDRLRRRNSQLHPPLHAPGATAAAC